jgi:CDP-diglyceride synthetase
MKAAFISTRVMTGLALLVLVLVVLFVPHPLPLTLLVWILGMVGLWEYMTLVETDGQVVNLAF